MRSLFLFTQRTIHLKLIGCCLVLIDAQHSTNRLPQGLVDAVSTVVAQFGFTDGTIRAKLESALVRYWPATGLYDLGDVAQPLGFGTMVRAFSTPLIFVCCFPCVSGLMALFSVS
jgi:hypothetical protein